MFKRMSVVVSILVLASMILSACAPAAAPAPAAEEKKMQICQINDMGGVDDKSFNATAWKGVTDSMAKYNVDGTYLESEAESDYEKNINTYLGEDCDLIISVGFLIGEATKAAAIANPDQKFGIIDDVYDPVVPNAVASVYNIDEATFLAGYLAASQTKTKIVGTYVGMAFPSTTAFMDGFYMGVQKWNEVKGDTVKVIGWDPAVNTGLEVGNFSDVDKGKTISYGLLDEGADIIMPVAGPVGAGTLAAVKERGALMVGVDTDWSILYPEDSKYVLGSALKQMDLWLVDVIGTVVDGSFKGGTFVGTLENERVGLALGVDFKDKLDSALIAELDQLKADIIAGTISVKYPR